MSDLFMQVKIDAACVEGPDEIFIKALDLEIAGAREDLIRARRRHLDRTIIDLRHRGEMSFEDLSQAVKGTDGDIELLLTLEQEEAYYCHLPPMRPSYPPKETLDGNIHQRHAMNWRVITVTGIPGEVAA